MPRIKLGAAPNVVIVHSTNLQEDQETLMALFPDRFQMEKHGLTASISLLSEDQLNLILVSSAQAKGTYAIIVLEEETIRQATERAVLYGVQTEERTLSETTIVKLRLPGGASLLATTADVWKDEVARHTAIACLLAPPSVANDTRPSATRFESPKPGRPALILSPPFMQRSASMSDIPHGIDGPPLHVSNKHFFPSLRVKVLEKEQKFGNFALNSENAIPVETELFVGRLLLVMRPSDPEVDPYWNERIFSKKKRRVVMQLQGKLKYKPEGVLYAGMEISDPMKLGLIASGLCNILLKMSQKFNPQIHYSFGDDKEQPHISFPASTFFERMVVTPPGEEPPPIDEEFEEPADAMAKRKAYKTKIDWNTEDTYSMSFHSMYLDFPTWTVVKLPIGRDLSLQTFWGNSSASVVLYETDEKRKQHLASMNKYLCVVQMKYLGKDEQPEDDIAEDRSSESEWSEEKFIEVDLASLSTNGENSLVPSLDDDPEDENLEFFDTVQSQSFLPASLDTGLADITAASSHSAVLRLIDEFCPCTIDMIGNKGKYVAVYAFRARRPGKWPMFRTYELSQDCLGDRHLVEVDKTIFSHRLAPREDQRRRIGLRYAEALMGKASLSRLNQFQKVKTSFDTRFLQRTNPQKKTPTLTSGFVARAVSDRRWIEEWGCITNTDIQFYHADKSKPYFQMSLSSVVKVHALSEDEAPHMTGFFFLCVETFGRSTCLMFASEADRDKWIELIKEHRPKPELRVTGGNSFTNHLIDVDEPAAEFLQRSLMWDCNKRKVLNSRKFSFRTSVSTGSESTLVLAERALIKATSLEPKGPNDNDLIEFLDSASALKEADAHSLNEKERKAFFLNVYHVMIMHAFLVLGPPDSSLKWLSYFNTIAYQCSDEMFSLAELEHNIVRADMSYPSNFLSRFVLPKSQYPFALTKPDFRINFALNCGSLSIPLSTVPVYQSETVDAQLEAVTKAFLEKTAMVKRKGSRDVSITLPKICQWFAEDFGGEGTTSDIVKAVAPFLDKNKQALLQLVWNDRRQMYDLGIWNIKYLPYSFECRFLTLDASSSLSRTRTSTSTSEFTID